MRKIIQISSTENELYALCDDGTVWRRVEGGAGYCWYKVNCEEIFEEQ